MHLAKKGYCIKEDVFSLSISKLNINRTRFDKPSFPLTNEMDVPIALAVVREESISGERSDRILGTDKLESR